MKIEKLNENQIKCILTNADLSSRKIDLSELAYGSEKAKNLFYDMMQQAQHEFGFTTGGTPLVVEAIPSRDCLTLIITKVTDPEELDARFSSFSSPQAVASSELHLSGADNMLNLLKKIKDVTDKAAASRQKGAPPAAGTEQKGLANAASGENASSAHLVVAFRFRSLDDVILAARAVPSPGTRNSLYKYDTDVYLLIMHSPEENPERFNQICNVLSEYSVSDHCSEASESYLKEHGYLMIADTALQKLAAL